MKPRISAVLLWLAIALLSACAMQRYHPAPIAAAASASRLENRSLRDAGLHEYMEKALGHAVSWPLRRWDLASLTLAALYFSPQMEIARDRVAAARGAIVTAGEHPNPRLSLTPGIPSPWLFDLPLVFPIETHGKRALRIEEARRLSSAAELAVAQTEWNVASGVRKALLAYRLAQARLALSEKTERTQTRQVAMLRQRLVAGEGARPPLEAAELALSNLRFSAAADRGRVATTRAALTGAIGVPAGALNGVQLVWPDFGRLPSLASLAPGRIERDAVLNRIDVRQALDRYAAADAALRLQIARQYPNFNIGPGYAFEEGNNYFTVPFSMILPIRNRNQGPIAQAEALRKEAAAKFLAVQARAIAQSQQALAAYRSALAELREANRPLRNQGRQVQLTTSAVAAGQSDRLQLNTLLLEGAVYARQRLQALARAQSALGELENAVERPLVPGEALPAVLPDSTANEPASPTASREASEMKRKDGKK